MPNPTITTILSTPPQHLPSSPCAAVCHGTPETEPPRLVFGFLGPSPLPWLAFVNAQPYYHHHVIHTTPALPPIALSHHLPRHTRNRATTLGFRVFRPTPLPRLPPSHPASPPPHHPSTSPHRPVPPFAMTHPKPSHHSLFSGFRPQPPLLARVFECAIPPSPLPYPHHATSTSHHPSLPFATAHPKLSHCTQFSGLLSVYIIFCHNNNNIKYYHGIPNM